MGPSEVTPLLVSSDNSLPERDSARRILRANEPEHPKSSAGYVGSMVLAVFMISASTAQEVSVYVSDHPKYYVQIVNSIYVLSAFGILLACWSKRINRAETRGHREIETVVALVIFWIFGTCYDYMTIGYKSYCFEEWFKFGRVTLVEIVVDTFYRLIRPIYKFSLVLVYTLCMNSVFPDKRTVRYGLMFIISTNLSIWVELLFDEAVHDDGTSHQLHNAFDNKSGNDTHAYCFGNHSGIDQVMSTGTRICVPSMVEFTLLIVECVMHWFTHCESKIEVPEIKTEIHEDTSSINSSIRECWNFKFWLKDADCWSIFFFSLTVLCSIVLNVLFGVFSAEASSLENFSSHLADRYIYYSTAFWSLNIMVTICTYLASRRFVSSNLSFKNLIGIERLLLLSLFGPILMGFFSFISIFHEWRSTEFPNVQTPWKYFFQEAANTLQILIQVPLIFYVRRIKSDSFDSSEAREATLALQVEIDSTASHDCSSQEVIQRHSRERKPLSRGNDAREFARFMDYGATAYSINAENALPDSSTEVVADVHTPNDTTMADSEIVSLRGSISAYESRQHESVEGFAIRNDGNSSERSRVVALSQNNRTIQIIDNQNRVRESIEPLANSPEVNQIGRDDRTAEGAPKIGNVRNNCDNNVKTSLKRLHCVINWPKYVLLAAIFHLLISNAMHWIANNFVDPRYEGLTLVKAYFNPVYWPIVASVLAPLEIFFRFHSMMLFIRAWRGLSFIKTTTEDKRCK